MSPGQLLGWRLGRSRGGGGGSSAGNELFRARFIALLLGHLDRHQAFRNSASCRNVISTQALVSRFAISETTRPWPLQWLNAARKTTMASISENRGISASTSAASRLARSRALGGTCERQITALRPSLKVSAMETTSCIFMSVQKSKEPGLS